MNRQSQDRARRAVLLFSGGLDSLLALEALRRAGIEVTVLICDSVFSPPGERHAPPGATACLRRDVSRAQIELIKAPRYGLGKNANPCLDCKEMMYGLAWREAQRLGAQFIATGEVLGQRPMSQRREALARMEKGAGVVGRVVRPLSGKLLPPTLAEEEELVDREDLLDISGRSRKRQMALAAEWAIRDYPTPAGGCKLTDPQYGARVLHLLRGHALTVGNAKLVRHGRLFGLGDGAFLVLGRNHEDNQGLLRDAPDGCRALELTGRPGPLGCLLGRADGEQEEEAKRLVVQHSRFRELPASEVTACTIDMMRQTKAGHGVP